MTGGSYDHPLFPTTPPNTLLGDARVSSLLDENIGKWRSDLVNQIFMQDDSDVILSMPHSHGQAIDRLVWAYTPRGTFTVHNAYKIANSLSNHTHAARASNDQSQHLFWHTLWSLNIPPKLKIFAWRACCNILPTKVNLCHRGVIEDATCEACQLGEETSGHMFWECTKARDTWTSMGLPLDIKGIQFREYVDLLWHLIFIQHASKDMLELIITISWCIWYNKNKTRLGYPWQSSHDIIMKARSMLYDFHLAHFQYCQPSATEEVRWTPPVSLCYKVNMDATVLKSTKSVGIGVIVRDHMGDVLAALSTQLLLPLVPLEAEAKAMDVAISFTKVIVLQEVTFESDCSVLIGALSDTSKLPISIEIIVTGIHNKLQHFRQHQMLHAQRQGHTPAHHLAHHAKGLDNFVTWIEETPSFIEFAVIQDGLLFSHY